MLEPGTCRSQPSLGKEMMVRKSLKCLACYVLVVVRKNTMSIATRREENQPNPNVAWSPGIELGPKEIALTTAQAP